MKFPYRLLVASSFIGFVPGQSWAQSIAPAFAQADSASDPDDASDITDIILVRGDRLRGQLNVEQATVLELNEADIEAIGATSIAELIDAISPQTGSSRGRSSEPPVFLVNGIRIGSFREMRSYPPEAVAKMEVLPEEVAQRFGYPPDRRVVNLILKENFSSREVQAEVESPDRGGYWRNEQEFTLLKIRKGARLNLNLKANDVSMLTEAERDVIQTPGSVPTGVSDEEFARYRSLVADAFELQGSVNWAKAVISAGTSLSFNLTGDHNTSRQLSGLRDVVSLEPLEHNNETNSVSSSASFGTRLGAFQLTVTGDGTLSSSRTRIDRIAATGFDTSRSDAITTTTKATMQGNLLDLPAGELTATFNTGFDWKRIESSDTRSASDTSFVRRRLDGGASIVIPIAERGGAWGAIGDLSTNFSAGLEDLSDFGRLQNWTAGLTWKPTSSLTLSATRISSEAAPSLTQLGAPQTVTYNVPVYDFVRGESVLAAVTLGGNPNLKAETQRDWKFSTNWELPFWRDTRFSVDYVRNNSSDVTSSFPAITAEAEAAFPGRITRDAGGQVVAVDSRPVTYDSTRTRRLVFGLTTRGSFGEAKPQAASDASPQGARTRAIGGGPSQEQRAAFMRFREEVCAEDGANVLQQLAEAVQQGDDLSNRFPGFDSQRAAQFVERFTLPDGKIDREKVLAARDRICSLDLSRMGGPEAGGPPRGAANSPPPDRDAPSRLGRPSDDGRGRYFANLTHTIELDSTVLITPAGPRLDLLDGDALGDFATPRHTSSLEVGMFRSGRGLRISGSYSGKSRIDGSGLPGSTDLYFGDLAKIDLRLFADLGRMLKKEQGILQNLRGSLRIDNVFGARRKVRDNNGEVPLSYQPMLIDPTGRYLGLELRKIF